MESDGEAVEMIVWLGLERYPIRVVKSPQDGSEDKPTSFQYSTDIVFSAEVVGCNVVCMFRIQIRSSIQAQSILNDGKESSVCCKCIFRVYLSDQPLCNLCFC